MTTLEDALVGTFAERAAAAGAVPADLADRAMAAGRGRRRRTASLVALALCAFAATGVPVVARSAPRPGVGDDLPAAAPAAAADRSEPTASERPPIDTEIRSAVPMMAPQLPVELVSDGRLYTRDGRVLPLALAARKRVEQVYRAPDGYVVVENESQRRGWFVNARTGAEDLIFDQATWVAVADDGSGRLAWVSGGGMYYKRSPGAGAPPSRTVAPADGGPIGFVGEAVLLGDPGDSGGTFQRHDLWFPTQGDYRPTWVDLVTVFGMGTARRDLVGVRRGVHKEACLSFVAMTVPVTEQVDCKLLDTLPYRGWVSPGGRWLVVLDGAGANVFDLFGKLAPGTRVGLTGPNVRADAAWLDQDTIALHDADRLVVLPLRATATAREYRLPADALVVRQ